MNYWLSLMLFFVPSAVGNLPPFWDEASDHISGFPLVSGETVIDPWNYIHRLGIYKVILKLTEEVMEPFGPYNKGNVLWGLPLQFGWQFSSGRLRDFLSDSELLQNNKTSADLQTQPPNKNVSPNSWWGSCNYFLAVVPFHGAQYAGYFNTWPHTIRILKPNMTEHRLSGPSHSLTNWDVGNSTQFCTTIDECMTLVPEAMNSWISFFKFIKSQSTLEYNQDTFQKHLWQAHIQTVKTFVPMFEHKLGFMPEEESLFGSSWVSLVDLIASCRFPTDFFHITKQQKMLPPRVLIQGDKAPFIPDINEEANRVLVIMENLYFLNKKLGGYPERLWQKMMCSASARREGRYLIEHLPSHLLACFPATMRLFWYSMTESCDDS